MTTKNRALITGAEGFIGSHLVGFLHDQGWDVLGTYLSRGQKAFSKTSRLHFQQCDLRNRQRVSHLIREYRPTHVFHLGAQSLPMLSWTDPVGTFEANIMGSLYLFEAIRSMKRPPIVVSACSSAQYGNVPPSQIPVREEQLQKPLHPYGISKVCLDLLAREYFLDYGIPAVNIRLFNTTGPGKTNDAPSDFVRQLVRMKRRMQPAVIEVGNLKPLRAYLDVRDAVRGFYFAATKGERGEAYNLCATTPLEIGRILRTAIDLSGVKPEIRPAKRLMRPSDERIIFGDTRKFRKKTGWKPLHSLKETLSSMLDYWEKHLEGPAA